MSRFSNDDPKPFGLPLVMGKNETRPSRVQGHVLLERPGQRVEVFCPFCYGRHCHSWRCDEPHPFLRRSNCMMGRYEIEVEDFEEIRKYYGGGR